MALLTLSNEGAPAHVFHLMEAPTMRLPNVKMLLCWSSRTQINGFVENHTFLEQFVSMGGTSTIFQSGGTRFGALVWYMSFYTIFWIIWLHWLLICMVTIWYKSMGVNTRHRVRADLSCNERSELAKGVLQAKTGMGRSP